MRKLYYLLILALTFGLAKAQPTRYGNEWIDYSKSYYKVYVNADGIYRIPYSLLDSKIPNLSTVNAANFVMFHNGHSLPIYVSTGNGTIDSTTYIEFFGKKNIGDVDSVLFYQPGYQPGVYYSFFTDTSIYFLSVNNQTNNPRYTFVNNDTLAIPTLTEEPFFTALANKFFTSAGTYSGGANFYTGETYVYKSIYDKAEAWGSPWFNFISSTPLSINLATPSVYSGAGADSAIFNIHLFTRTWEQHEITVKLNSTQISDIIFDNSQGGATYHPIWSAQPASSLNAINTVMVKELSLSSSSQENLVMYSEIKYPRKFEFDNSTTFNFQLKAAAGSRYFKASLFNDAGTRPLLYDITNGYIIRSTEAPGTSPKRYILPAAAGDRELHIRADNSGTYTVINRMDTTTFQNYTALAAQGNYMVISHPVLMRDSTGHNYVADYVNYRDRVASPSTGKYDARVFDINQIIDQFGYGVRKDALAIRNFIEYAYDNWTKKPEYLFIVGKGVDYYNVRRAPAGYNICLVPTFGWPASDNLLTYRRGTNHPLIAIGRLAARTPMDVAHYLDKIRTYESYQDIYGDPHQNKPEKLWQKQIMHLAGGATTDEQLLFLNYLDGYGGFGGIAKDTSWGAHTFTIYKNTGSPIDVTQSNIIDQHIDSGLSLMTFFGHAAGTAFDIAVKDPEQWSNYYKYPFVYSNGCFAGSIHDPVPAGIFGTYGERFVLTPGKAAIAFLATTGASVSTGLYNFGAYTYTNFSQKYYNQPMGKAIQHAQYDLDSAYGTDDFSIMIAYDMTLHGDPAIKLSQYDRPDYQIDQNSVYFTPQTINPSVDSFNVNVIITNLGKAIKDSIQVTIHRRYPDPANPANIIDTAYNWKVHAPYYIDTVSFKLPTLVNQQRGYGQNQFSVLVESQQRIAELSETNNGQDQGYNFGFFIESDDVIPVYPYEFAIVPQQGVVLKASTVDPFAPNRNYRLQIDTSALFRHPLAQTTIRQSGGVLHWSQPLTMRDSTVYYWRVSRDSINDTLSYRWHASSFLYIHNEFPGWNQSHFFQYQRDKYPDNVYIDSDRIFKFVPTVHNMRAVAGWSSATGGPGSFPAANLEWDFDGLNQYRYRMGNCAPGIGYANTSASGGFTFGIVDTVTGNVLASINQSNNFGQYGNVHCNNQLANQYGFDFNVVGNHPAAGTAYYSSIPWSQVIINFLDSLPTGSVFIMYTNGRPQYSLIDSQLVNRLVNMGAKGLRNLVSGAHAPAPYIFSSMKGRPSFGGEATGVDYTVPLDTNFSYKLLWNKGTYVSPNIGPATQWGSFHWRWRSREARSADKQAVDIVGVNNNGTQTLLAHVGAQDTTLNFVNPVSFPYIYLRMNAQDDTNHSPSQLYYWRVLFKPVPEAVINPAAHFVVTKDTVGMGDSLNIEIALENVTELPMDSIRTLYTIKSLQNAYTQNIIIKSDSLRAFQTQILKFKRQIPTTNMNLAGRNRLVIEANPIDALHQLEEYHFNNYATIDFTATGDKINPLLDVTFDSRRIMNGDIVSSKPSILITMKDENKYLALNDTGMAKVYIRYPGQIVPTLVNYDNNILTFYPATGDLSKRNQARIELKPTFTIDGSYELLVRDRDYSGNFSSSSTNGRWEGTVINGVYYDYKVTFNVITKSMITNVLNYPNPFTTRTQFVFTLTGSTVPDYMKIQIMTITGKVVKEILKEQLGNIHVGVNKTDYYWDGRDEYGDKLANGTYFYRVITNLNNKQMDHMSSTEYGQFFNNTDIDKYFKHGFGKLVIMR